MSRFATPAPQSGVAPQAPAVLASSNDSHPTTSMSSDLAAPVQELAALTQTLFASLAPASTRPPPPPPVEAFIAVDDTLRVAVARAREHQVRQRRIVQLEEQILEQEARWKALVAELEQGRQELGAMIEEGDRRIAGIREAKESTVTTSELLSYAKILANHTSAPPGLADDMNIMMLPPAINMPVFNPPFPNEEKMARGRLGMQASLGQAGETHPIGQVPETKEPELGDREAPGRIQYRADVRPSQPLLDLDLDLDLNPDL